MAKLIELKAAIEIIKKYGKTAIAAGRKSLDPVDDIILIADAVGHVPVIETKTYDTHWSNERAYKKAVKDFAERVKELFPEEDATRRTIDTLAEEIVGVDNA